MTFDDLLATAATWLLTGSAAWTLLILGATAVETSTAGRLRATAWVGCPPALRRALLSVLGVALVTTPVQAGAASTGSASGSRSGARTTALQGLPSPARPSGDEHSRHLVVVHRGDTLWHLAEGHLSDSASDAQVASLVARLHQSNREVIGPDPDLIHPGQRLLVPRPGRHDPRHHLEENP
jgi:nucleoid-associated protein YgaU